MNYIYYEVQWYGTEGPLQRDVYRTVEEAEAAWDDHVRNGWHSAHALIRVEELRTDPPGKCPECMGEGEHRYYCPRR